MIYRYDEPVDMPVPELYDTGLMGTYINAVKQQYDEGVKRLDDFTSKYGDFTSPFAKDVENWDKLTRGRMNDVIADLESRGIDPYRSQEGRTMLAKAIRETPVAALAKLKQSATAGQEYLKHKADLQSKGMYNQAMEDYFQKTPFEQWSTLDNGQFDRVSPIEYKDLHSLTDDWFKHLTPKYNDDLTKQKNDGYNYSTVDENDIQGVITSHMPDFAASDYGKYYYNLEVEAARRANPNASEADVQKIAMSNFREDVVNRNSDYLQMHREVDPYAKMKMEQEFELKKQAIDHAFQRQQARAKAAGSTKSSPTNYHQSQANMAAFVLAGGDRAAYMNYALTGDIKSITNVGKNAGKRQYALLQSIPHMGKEWGYTNKALGKLTVGNETLGVIASRYGQDVVDVPTKNGGVVNGIPLTSQIRSIIEGTPKWVSRSRGSKTSYKKLKTRSAQSAISDAEKNNKKILLVPYGTNNLKAHVTRKGSLEVGTHCRVYSYDDDGNGTAIAEVILPISHTTSMDGTIKNGKYVVPETNTTAIDPLMQGTISDYEAGVMGTRLKSKNTDQYTNPTIQ